MGIFIPVTERIDCSLSQSLHSDIPNHRARANKRHAKGWGCVLCHRWEWNAKTTKTIVRATITSIAHHNALVCLFKSLPSLIKLIRLSTHGSEKSFRGTKTALFFRLNGGAFLLFCPSVTYRPPTTESTSSVRRIRNAGTPREESAQYCYACGIKL